MNIQPHSKPNLANKSWLSTLLIICFGLCLPILSVAQTTSWMGTSSTSWSNAANWSNGVPSATVNAIIGDSKFTGANQPTISYSTSCNSLTVGGTKLSVISINAPLSISGNVSINSNGTVALNNTLTLTGNWSNSGTFSSGGVNSNVVFAGATQNYSGANVTTFRKLTISKGSTLKMNKNFTVSGTGNLFTINGTLDPNEAPAYVATIGDVILNDGSTVKITTNLYSGNYIINGTVIMNPGFIVEYASNTVDQVVTNVLVYSTLKISGSSTKTLAGALTALNSSAATRGNIYINGGTFDIGANLINRGATVAGGTISVGNGAKLRIGGTNSFPTNYSTIALGSSGTVEYYGSTQSIRALSYGNLTLSNAGTKTAAGILDIAGDFNLSTSTFVAGAYTHMVAGNWNMTSGTFTNTGSTINFDGVEDQDLTSTDAFNNVKINKASGSLILASDATIKALTFTKGTITADGYKVIIPSGGTLTGASASTGWVNGDLQKYYSAATGGTYEVGGPAHYTPINVVFGSITTAGNLVAGATASAHPNIGTSNLSNKNISRYFTLAKPATGGIVYNNITITFNWNAADNYTPMVATALNVGLYANGAWSYPTKSGASTATNIKVSGVTTIGDFAVGEANLCTLSSGFNYAATSYCSNANIIAVRMNTGSTKGTFTSSPAGLSIDANTGAINPSASIAGSYVITNTAVVSLCTSSSNYTLAIVDAPSATINYGGTGLCKSGGLKTVTRTGKAGGTYSSTAGLDLNSTTGQIDPAGSTPGTYTVTYTINAASGCSAFSTTTTVTITEANFAIISYPKSPYCRASGDTATVEITGANSGTFSPVTGLSINTTTGDIALGSSAAGTYTVTYTAPAANGCAAVSASTSITISATATATISYAGSPFCGGTGIINVTRTGTAGGTYDSDNGLDLNEITGAINLNNSLPDTYIVVYNGAGCQATTTVILKAIPSASISYGPSSLCKSGGTANVILNGTTGGTYTANAGLSITASTGAINLAASNAGNYTVTYTIPAANNCSQFVTSTTLTIVAAPTATISYTGAPFCVTASAKSVSRSGTAGGTYSALPAGLNIDATSGSIVPSTSVAGTYTVSYTIAAANGCIKVVATAIVAITAIPAPVISYTASPYCVSGGTANVTLSGTTGGVFSGAGSLVINAATGAINLAASGAGSFEVKYNIAAQSGCSAVEVKTTIVIKPVTTATINYKDNPYYNADGDKTVDLTGSNDGTFSATPAGLAVDTISGKVSPQTSTPGIYIVTYTVDAGTGCAAFTTTTSVTIKPSYIWKGITNNWKENTNWSSNLTPDDKSLVIIPTGLAKYPVIAAADMVAAYNLDMQGSATLTLEGKLQLTGSITAPAKSISAQAGTLELKSAVAQTIPGNAFTTEVANIIVDNVAGVTLTSQLSIGNIFSIKNGFINTNGYLVINSNSVSTARIGAITSNAATPIIGEVTVERYIAGRRKYRLITSSVTTSTSSVLTAGEAAKSIWGNWQNAGVATPGAGTIITGGTAADGFDQATNNASLYTYNDVTKRFVSYTSANGKNTKLTPLKAGVGYYMFVYGDRINSVTSSTPNPTTLKQTGTILTGTQVYNTTSAIPISATIGNYSLIGNPYACTIDWKSVLKTNISKTIWGWDANLASTGGYVTVTATTLGALISPLSSVIAVNRYVQPGQAFFVQTTAANPRLTISETDKIDDRININSSVFRETGVNEQPLMAINLLYNNGLTTTLNDGALLAFDDNFDNAVTYDDGLKIAGAAEGLAIVEDASLLSISTRKFPVDNDTMKLSITKLTKSQYTLQIFARQLNTHAPLPWLYDAYLNTLEPLSVIDTNYINFTIIATDATSKNADRFKIVFKMPSTLPVTFTGINATRKNKDIEVQWNVAGELNILKYELQKSADGVRFTTFATVAAKGNNNSSQSYTLLDNTTFYGSNYYQVKSLQVDGKQLLSKVVMIKMDNYVPSIKVYPNPTNENQINFQIIDLKKGIYKAILFNSNGQQISEMTIDYKGGSGSYKLPFSRPLAKGMYYLNIKCDGENFEQMVLIQ